MIHLNSHTIVTILLIALILTSFVMLLYYLICRDENKHKDFRKNISVGDEAFITHLQSRNGFDGIVTKVDEEFVTIETKVRKHLIYPKTKNNV